MGYLVGYHKFEEVDLLQVEMGYYPTPPKMENISCVYMHKCAVEYEYIRVSDCVPRTSFSIPLHGGRLKTAKWPELGCEKRVIYWASER